MSQRPRGRSWTQAAPAVRGALAAATRVAFGRLAAEAVQADSALEPTALKREVVRRLVRVTLVAWADAQGLLDRGMTARSGERTSSLDVAWQRLVEAVHFVPSSAEATRIDGTTEPSRAIGAFVDAIRALLRDVSPADAGAVLEILEELAVLRAESPHVCLRPKGHWVSAAGVLAEAPEIRARWVQRSARLPKTAVAALSQTLRRARTPEDVIEALSPFQLPRIAVARSGAWVVQASLDRRKSGAHYTPWEMARRVVARTLEPLVTGKTSNELCALRVCDPAMGSGVFLLAAAEYLTEQIVAAWTREGSAAPDAFARAIVLVLEHCLYGADENDLAVETASVVLGIAALAAGNAEAPRPHVVCGNALVDDAVDGTSIRPLPWTQIFPEVFDRTPPGFDAIIGNPPWVAYVGRAAQPLEPSLFDRFARESPAFAGYRTLHGLFVWRASTLLRVGGRLGLVLPTSMADLEGYAPTRRAHDELCEADSDLYDFGDGAFDAVFQPSMALTSTRRAPGGSAPRRQGEAWPLERRDLGPMEREILRRLRERPVLPRDLFGERGFQTTGSDLARLSRKRTQSARVPLHEGGDVGEFRLATPRIYVDPAQLTGRFRPEADWRAVPVFIRQTARYPIATRSDGHAFRNSILAGFANARWSADALVAYLNASAVRWYHYFSHRDARQGMPQLKVGHLRTLPDVDDATLTFLDSFGRHASTRAAGLTEAEHAELDSAVARGFGLTPAEQRLIAEWARAHPLPRARRPAAMA